MESVNSSPVKLEKLIDMATQDFKLFIDSLRFEPLWFQRLIYVIGQITCDFTESNTVMHYEREHWNQFWSDEDVKLMNPYNCENVKEMKRVLNVYNKDTQIKSSAAKRLNPRDKEIFLGYNFAKLVFIGITFRPEFINEFVEENAEELTLYSESQRNVLKYIYKQLVV
jgi:hypothetical protein